jgi:hypothetical protein
LFGQVWKLDGLTAAVVPEAALGTGFSVLVLPPRSWFKISFVGLPRKMKVEELIAYMEARGATIEIAPELAGM